jgi:murein L,D-transpeptidase YcbB/YkuD
VAAALLLLSGGSWAEGCDDPLSAAPRLTAAALDLDALRGFYREPAACVWTDASAALLQAVLARLGEEGLDPEQFHAAALAERATPTDSAVAAERDLLASDAALAYARAMVEGRVDPAAVRDQIWFPRPNFDPAELLRMALDNGELAAWLAGLPPSDPQYAALKAALVQYRGLTEWLSVQPPEAKTIEPGQRTTIVPALAQRLAAEGDLAAGDAEATASDGRALDGPVLAALKHFQQRHGLTPDGRLGKQSFVSLNVSLADRIGQIVANLERRREVAHLLPPTRIEVNVASATLTVLRDGEPVSSMRAVVGDPEHQTPMLISSIRDVEVNPPWIVPASIIQKEIRPKLRRDPTYLERNDMTWTGGQLIQAPGAKNSLGHLKFEFPNPFSVYLHDTPMHRLFALDARELSHGCVRLEHPLDLAQLLLAASKPDSIQQAIDKGQTTHIRLPESMPVAVLYWSAYVEADGTVDFRDDLYQRDARLVAALKAPHRTAAGTAEHCTGTCRNT